jgi:protein required for attachment to host cells
MTQFPAGTLVMVADGQKARLFRYVGDGQALQLRQEEMMDAQHLSLQGPSGVAPPEQTVEQTNEASFAMHVAHWLNHEALAGRYADLVLVADPQTLGQIRPQLHKETLGRLRKEIAKTLTNSPLEDITAALD